MQFPLFYIFPFPHKFFVYQFRNSLIKSNCDEFASKYLNGIYFFN